MKIVRRRKNESQSAFLRKVLPDLFKARKPLGMYFNTFTYTSLKDILNERYGENFSYHVVRDIVIEFCHNGLLIKKRFKYSLRVYFIVK